MPDLSDIALLVEERVRGEFFWVLIEAIDDESSEATHYRRFQSASGPQTSYSNALALGAAALRRLADALSAPPPGAGASA